MSYTLGEAARATGKSKPTIARAIKRGLISATKAADGSFQIDPAELERVFHLSGNGAGTLLRSVPGGRDAESLELLLAERERLVTEQAEAIRDLRARLDLEAEERRRVQTQLTAVLTDRTAAERPPSTLWERWLRWRKG